MKKHLLPLAALLPLITFSACNKKSPSQAEHTGDCCPPPSEVKIPKPVAPTAAEIEQTAIPQLTETPEQLEQRIQWFRDAKFGLFIHWGPAAISGQEISWSMMDRIEAGDKHKVVPRETYMNLYKDFNPTKFKYGVGDATIAKIQGNYYIYCDRESQGSPYKVTAWRSKSLMEPFEYLGLAITPRSKEVDDWDNYRIQDADIAYIPELKRYVMTCNMMDKDGNPGGCFFRVRFKGQRHSGDWHFLFGQKIKQKNQIEVDP